METLPESTLMEFMQYNNWANQAVLHACQKLNEAQLATKIPGAYGTIRDTLEHIIRAEAGYIRLLTGSRPQPPFKWEAGPSLAEMAVYSMQVGNALVEAAQHVPSVHQVDQEMDGKQLHFRALAVFIQIIDHGIEHRTNITTILNQGLGSAPEVDGWGYLMSHPDRFELR
ncbi:MAG TPA: DinB family protein [Anaerolineales bacterium]|nr:DinB family protein [Anaerolineales bacterium]